MRRFPIFIILLLSFLLPLHVVASTVLSAQTCPEQSAMASDASSDKAMPDCCDESDKSMDCQQMTNCHGCQIGCQLFTSFTPAFHFSSDVKRHPLLNTPAVGLFDPASVWRPPNELLIAAITFG